MPHARPSASPVKDHEPLSGEVERIMIWAPADISYALLEAVSDRHCGLPEDDDLGLTAPCCDTVVSFIRSARRRLPWRRKRKSEVGGLLFSDAGRSQHLRGAFDIATIENADRGPSYPSRLPGASIRTRCATTVSG